MTRCCAGFPYRPEQRSLNAAGGVEHGVGEPIYLASAGGPQQVGGFSRGGGARRPEPTPRPPAFSPPARSAGVAPSRLARDTQPVRETVMIASKNTKVFSYGVNRDRLMETATTLGIGAEVTASVQEADMVLTTKVHYRKRGDSLQYAQEKGLPIYVLRKNSQVQMEQFLKSLSAGLGRRRPPAHRECDGGNGRGCGAGLRRRAVGRAIAANLLCSTAAAPVGRALQPRLREPGPRAATPRGDLPPLTTAREKFVPQSLFITFEGGEAAGKSTQVRLLSSFLRDAGRRVVTVAEPGSTALGARVRRLVKFGSMPIGPRAEALLFVAARAQLVEEIIAPALAEGDVVVSDRFGDSTLAYQGYGRGLDVDELRRLNESATGGLQPDLTVLLDMPVDVSLMRRRPRDRDRFEAALGAGGCRRRNLPPERARGIPRVGPTGAGAMARGGRNNTAPRGRVARPGSA